MDVELCIEHKYVTSERASESERKVWGTRLGPLRRSPLCPFNLAVRWLGEVQANTRPYTESRTKVCRNSKRSHAGQKRGPVVAPALPLNQSALCPAPATICPRTLISVLEIGLGRDAHGSFALELSHSHPPALQEEAQGLGARVFPGGPLARI